MPSLKYAWLQDVLADLIRFSMEMSLHSATHHLNQALRQVRLAETAATEQSEAIQSTTVRLALEDCLNMLADLGEQDAADDVRNALQHIHRGGHAQNIILLNNARKDAP